MGSGSPSRAAHKLVGLALEVSDYSEALPLSRFGLERPADLFASTLHHCMGFPSEEVGAALVLFPSVLGRKDPVRMVMISLAVWLNFVSGDVVNVKSHMFALHHVNIIV